MWWEKMGISVFFKNFYLTFKLSQCLLHYGKKGIKWGINFNFSEKTTMIFAAENVLHKYVLGKI
jgi:hypothetical protein